MKHWVVSCIAFSLVPFALCFVIPKLSKESRRLMSLKSLNYGGIQHAGLLVKNVEESKKFFMEVFDFTDDTHLRPTTLPFRGAFLKIGTHSLLTSSHTTQHSLTHSLGADQIHLMELANPDPTTGRPEHGGRDRHLAVSVSSIDIIKERLERIKHHYTMSNSGRRALFCRDLDGNAFEFMEDVALNKN